MPGTSAGCFSYTKSNGHNNSIMDMYLQITDKKIEGFCFFFLTKAQQFTQGFITSK